MPSEVFDWKLKALNLVNEVRSQQDRDLREKIYREIILPNRSIYRNGNIKYVGQDGWYFSFHPKSNEILHTKAHPSFQIPAESSNWYSIEFDSRDGLEFRFFDRKAWLDLHPPVEPSNLEFVIPYVLMNEVVEDIVVIISGFRIQFQFSDRDSFSRIRAVGIIPPDVCNLFMRSNFVKFEISCKHSGKPKDMYLGSNDNRKLSLAISYPKFIKKVT